MRFEKNFVDAFICSASDFRVNWQISDLLFMDRPAQASNNNYFYRHSEGSSIARKNPVFALVC